MTEPTPGLNASRYRHIGITVGIIIAMFYWLFYDPTVPEYPNTTGIAAQYRVYNVGKMHNRNIGLIMGLGLAAISAVPRLPREV